MEPGLDYRSHATLLGLPLLHIARGSLVDGRLRPGVARGWIAVGDIPFGVLIAVGGIAAGGMTLGGLGVGFISLAGLAVGFLALGGLGIGFLSAGGSAIAIKGAVGGLAVARDFALGGLAIAEHANDARAVHFFRDELRAAVGAFATTHSYWLAVLIAIPLFPVLRALRQREEQGPQR